MHFDSQSEGRMSNQSRHDARKSHAYRRHSIERSGLFFSALIETLLIDADRNACYRAVGGRKDLISEAQFSSATPAIKRALGVVELLGVENTDPMIVHHSIDKRLHSFPLVDKTDKAAKSDDWHAASTTVI